MSPHPRLATGVALACALLPALALSADRPRSAAAQSGVRPHVVILIFDEFPGDNMLGRDGLIDAVRFPAFARMARRSYWFPNASTWSPSTEGGVPSILDGRLPRAGVPPTTAGHPHSLYHAVARAGYRIVDGEETTSLCPRSLCSPLAVRSPPCGSIQCRFIGPGRVTRFQRWLRTVRPARRPTLWVKHLLLPHRPWIYLPSGLRTQDSRHLESPIHGLNRFGGPPDRFLRLHNYQRHLLQLRFTDRLLGRLLDRLTRGGMLDRTLLIATSDHGYSFTGRRREHRRLRPANVHQIASVPLLVKMPGQQAGRRDDALAANADVTPTVADALGVELGYPTDGSTVFGAAVHSRHSVLLAGQVGLSQTDFEQQRSGWRERRLQLFGVGNHGFWDGIGPNRQLVGRRIGRVSRARRGRLRAQFIRADQLRHVRRASGVLPVEVLGHIRHGSAQRHELALEVNGRIEAVARSFHLPGDPVEHFAIMLRPSALREGRNRVRLFDVGRGVRLRLIGTI
jgi:hypothetical protein